MTNTTDRLAHLDAEISRLAGVYPRRAYRASLIREAMAIRNAR